MTKLFRKSVEWDFIHNYLVRLYIMHHSSILMNDPGYKDGPTEAPGLEWDMKSPEAGVMRAFQALRSTHFFVALNMHGSHGLGCIIYSLYRLRNGNERFDPSFFPLAQELFELMRGLITIASGRRTIGQIAVECGCEHSTFTVLQYLQHRDPVRTAYVTSLLNP